jgi:immune inhibitor A
MPRSRKCDESSSDPFDLRERCCVAPSPQLRERMVQELHALSEARDLNFGGRIVIEPQKRTGFNDGMILPGTEYPLGTPRGVVRSAAALRSPLRGSVRVIVVLVDFSDEPMKKTPAHFHDLFFSTGTISTGSVREYYTEVTHGLVKLTGEVVGPYRLPRTLKQYAGGKSGTDNPEPNARTMARDAAKLADPDVNFAPYDNDGNGYVDAFIVVHAGEGAEETGRKNDIWSHKWVFAGGALNADGTKIFGYLTIPENCKIGVCAHELGHLLFGWPDLYDTDGSSEGLGNWCLMGGGSWNGNGDIPAHPSAWCKVNQGWVTVSNRKTNSKATINDVKAATGCSGSGRTARPARSTSWSKTASGPSTTGRSPEMGCSSITSTKRSTATTTNAIRSSSCWKPMAGTSFATAPTAATPAIRSRAARRTWR